ncbi:MAG: hypothetical protein ACR2KF_05930 [Nitrososphaeraceae archaeon]
MMLVVLAAGILTALTGTGISQVAPAFADKDECEDMMTITVTREPPR